MPVAIGVAFPALFPAVAIMLLVWAAVILFQKPLVALLSRLPVVGGAIADAVGGAIGTLISWAREFAAMVVLPLLELLTVPVVAFASILSAIVRTAESLIGEIARVAWVAAGAAGRVARDLAAAVASIANLANIVKVTQDAVAAARAFLATTIGTTIPRAIAEVQAWARSFVAAAIATARTAIDVAIASAVATASAVLWAPIKALQTAFAALPAWVQLRIAEAVAAVAGTLGIRLTGLEGLLGQLRAQVGTMAGELGAILPLALPIAFPALLTMVRTMQTQCVNPTCRVITPQLGTLDALLDGAMVLVMADLVRGAIDDPEGSARETARDVQGVIQAANGVIGPLFGVRV